MDNKLEKQYLKITTLINTIDIEPISDWTVKYSLAYIMKKYKDKFSDNFILSYNDVPSRSTDYKLVNRIWLMLGAGSGEGEIVKDYIDWFFLNYKGKNKFTSIGAMTKPKLIHQYKEYRKNNSTVNMTTTLPDNVIAILKETNETSYILKYGELAYFYESINNLALLDENSINIYNKIFSKLKNIGFDLNILKTL